MSYLRNRPNEALESYLSQNSNLVVEDGYVVRVRSRADSIYDGISLDESKRADLELLEKVWETACYRNWDGEGANAVEVTTLVYAKEFLSLLPNQVPTPYIDAEPDGEIAFEWNYGRRTVFSISVGRDGTLTYAGLFGYETTHGTESISQSISPAIANGIRRVIG